MLGKIEYFKIKQAIFAPFNFKATGSLSLSLKNSYPPPGKIKTHFLLS